jgi:hypothetical protein
MPGGSGCGRRVLLQPIARKHSRAVARSIRVQGRPTLRAGSVGDRLRNNAASESHHFPEPMNNESALPAMAKLDDISPFSQNRYVAYFWPDLRARDRKPHVALILKHGMSGVFVSSTIDSFPASLEFGYSSQDSVRRRKRTGRGLRGGELPPMFPGLLRDFDSDFDDHC